VCCSLHVQILKCTLDSDFTSEIYKGTDIGKFLPGWGFCERPLTCASGGLNTRLRLCGWELGREDMGVGAEVYVCVCARALACFDA
jgi:hypothetical protein